MRSYNIYQSLDVKVNMCYIIVIDSDNSSAKLVSVVTSSVPLDDIDCVVSNE